MKKILTLLFFALLAATFCNAQVGTFVTGSTFCGCSQVNVMFQAGTVANVGNVYTAQLSDISGSFATPVTIGTLANTDSNGTISCTIPCNTSFGTGYRIRVTVSNPFNTLPENSTPLTIGNIPDGTISTPTDTICAGTSVSLTVTGGPNDIQWQSSTDSAGPYTNVGDSVSFYYSSPLYQTTWFRVMTTIACAENSAPYPIFVVAPPFANFNYSVNGRQVSFDTTSVTGNVTSYFWNFGDNTTSSLPNPVHTFDSTGTWDVCLTIKNNSNCNRTICQNVPIGNCAISLHDTVFNASCGNNNGSIYLSVSGATPPVTYSWSNGATTQNLDSVGLGNYTVTVTDANNCSASETTFVRQISGPSISAAVTNSTCGNSTGGIALSVTGGTPAYTYLWTNGATTQNLTNIPANGGYGVTVTDAGGCSASEVILVYNTNGPQVTFTSTPPSCYGSDNGSIQATITGGTPPYASSWSNGDTGKFITGLPAGIECILVTDTLGCSNSFCDTLGQPAALTVSLAASYATCGLNNGNINAIVSGGAGNYVYQWSIGATTSDISNLDGGSYSVTVTDGNSCSALDTVTLNQSGSPVLTTNATNTTCGYNNGSITLTINGGTYPYNTVWSNNDSALNLYNLAGGLYAVTVTDANGCSATTSATVGQSTAISVTAFPTDATCGNDNGSVTLTVTGGTGNYTYYWSNNDTTQNLDTVGQGTYTVLVVDANGCSTVDSVTIGLSNGPNITFTVNNDTCNLQKGSLSATISGGVPPYMYSWSNGTTVSNLNNIGAGIYSVTVADANACAASASATVGNANLNCVQNNISGIVYLDENSDCIHEGSEPLLNNVKLDLYRNGALIGQTFAFGSFSFSTDTGNYKVAVDTTGLPFTFTCPAAGDSTVYVYPGDSNINLIFGLYCKPGFDIGVWDIHKTGFLFPGYSAGIVVDAGDIAKKIFSTSCNTGTVSGQLSVILDGPVNYIGYAPGSLQPTVFGGDTLVWDISDFSSLGPADSTFNFVVTAQTGAQLGQQVCINTAVLITTPGDRDSSNNHLDQCFIVSNSFDPNEKEVSPPGPLSFPYNGWLTYTVHFQNTGSAAANNIVVLDTLDANLAPETFQLLAYSSKPTVQITGRYVEFSFPNINLPDTATSLTASQGFVQYRVMPVPNLPVNSDISNSASIYFDYNSPVKTNTVSSQVENTTGVNELRMQNGEWRMYPNPASDEVIIVLSKQCDGCVLNITDVTGRTVMQGLLSGMQTTLDISSLAAGIYYVRVSTATGTSTLKMIKD